MVETNGQMQVRRKTKVLDDGIGSTLTKREMCTQDMPSMPVLVCVCAKDLVCGFFSNARAHTHSHTHKHRERERERERERKGGERKRG